MNAASRYQTIFFIAAFAAVGALSVFIFWPFLISLTLAAIIAVLVYPVYKILLAEIKSETASASITILLLILLIVAPLILLTNQIIQEAQHLYVTVSSGDIVSVDFLTQKVETLVRKYVPDFQFNAKEYLAGFSSWIIERLGGLFSGTLDFAVKFVLALVALFYFLRDGVAFRKQLSAFNPLSESKDKIIVDSVKSSIRSVLLGSLAVAVIQGLLSGIGFAIFGLPNATLWGTVAGVAALVPGVGTALVWIPAAAYLYFYGASGVWIAQVIWSVFLVGLIDNFLAPYIINKGVNVHPLFILFSILGGLQFFGPEGFLLGPLVVSFLPVLVKIIKLDESK